MVMQAVQWASASTVSPDQLLDLWRTHSTDFLLFYNSYILALH